MQYSTDARIHPTHTPESRISGYLPILRKDSLSE